MKHANQIAPVDQEAEAYMALLQKQISIQKYNLQTAKMLKKQLIAKQYEDGNVRPYEEVLAEQQNIIAQRPINAPSEVDIVKTLPFDVEKLQLLKNFTKMGMSNTQAKQLFDSIESRGGDAFKRNGLWVLTGHWSKLKSELLKQFSHGSSVALISNYIVDKFLPEYHITRTATEDKMIDEAQEKAVAAGDAKIYKRESRLEAVRTAAEKIKAGLYEGMPEPEPEPESVPVVTPAKKQKKPRVKKPAVASPIPQGVDETAEGLLQGIDSTKKAKQIIRTYIDYNGDIIARSDNRALFLNNDGSIKNLKFKTMEDGIIFFNQAIAAARGHEKVAANLAGEFADEEPVGKGLKFRLDKAALNRGQLSVRYHSSRLYKIKPIPISETVRDLISEMHDGKPLDKRLFNRLSAEEQRHIETYAQAFGIAAKQKITSKASKDLYEKYQILIGEVNAGNTNAKLKRDLRETIAQLVDIGRIPFKKAMLTLAQLGI